MKIQSFNNMVNKTFKKYKSFKVSYYQNMCVII